MTFDTNMLTYYSLPGMLNICVITAIKTVMKSLCLTINDQVHFYEMEILLSNAWLLIYLKELIEYTQQTIDTWNCS